MALDFFKKIFFEKRPLIKLIFFLISDIILIIFSVALAFLVRFEGFIPLQYLPNILIIIFLISAITLPIFYFFKLYSFSWIYVSTTELIFLVKATALSFLFSTAAFFVLRDHPIFSGFPRSTLFISYFFVFLFCGGLRFAKRIYWEIFKPSKKEDLIKVLIVGASNEGEQILRSIKTSPKSPYSPLGFVDDDIAKQKSLIHGVPVLGQIKDIPQIVKEKGIEEMIIALPFSSPKIKKAVQLGRQAKIRKIKILPSLTEMMQQEVSITSLKEIDWEDLLGREPIKFNIKLIENFIKNKVILITGASGSIGFELSQQVAKFKPQLLLLLDQDETGIFNLINELREKFPRLSFKSFIADIVDEKRLEKIFSKIKPQIIFHAAAYKHVPLMEENPEEAIKNNILGTENVAKIALKNQAESFIFISTDKAVNPTSVMGVTKRIGEMICQIQNKKGITKFICVRFGNVLDSRGSVIPIFKEQIKKGGPVTVTHPEMKRYFMLNWEACLLVLEASAIGQGGEVFVLDMGKPIKILDLAREMIRLSGYQPDEQIPIVFTGPRPGEKLFEEILTSEEGVLETKYPRILIAKMGPIDEQKLILGIEKLKEILPTGEKEDFIKIFKELVPSYQPEKY